MPGIHTPTGDTRMGSAGKAVAAAFEVDVSEVGAGLNCRGEVIRKEKAFILTVKLKPALAA